MDPLAVSIAGELIGASWWFFAWGFALALCLSWPIRRLLPD
jgi:hypothetical protein